MHTDRTARHGFTLVELLTVIAIIGILAGLTAAGLSRAITRAQMAEMYNRMGNVEDLLYIYYTDNGTFPPAYGYVHSDIRDVTRDCGPDGVPDGNVANDATPREDPALCLNPENVDAGTDDEFRPYNQFYLGSYLDLLDHPNNKDLYDPWSESYDTDGDGRISYLEYLPFEDRTPDDDDILYEDGTLDNANNPTEVQQLLSAGERPFIYIPVNRRQAERVGIWYMNNLDSDFLPDESNEPTDVNQELRDLLANELGNQTFAEFPPAKYDAFILISVGPQANTAGLIGYLTRMVDLNNYPENFRYHVLGHVLYFLATRDADNNGEPDLTYDGRQNLRGTDRLFPFPDPLYRRSDGPVILISSR